MNIQYRFNRIACTELSKTIEKDDAITFRFWIENDRSNQTSVDRLRYHLTCPNPLVIESGKKKKTTSKYDDATASGQRPVPEN